jgi:hypothetical protein
MEGATRALPRSAVLERKRRTDRLAGTQARRPEQARWVFDYDASRSDDDETGYRFGGHAFVPGEYVSIAHDNDLYTFKVVSIETAT